MVSLLLMTVQGAWAQYITDVMVIGHKEESSITALRDKYRNQKWTIVDWDLNDGAGGSYIFLMYKTGSSNGITGFYLRTSDKNDSPASLTHDGRTYYRADYDGSDGFKNAKGDLNNEAKGKFIHLYYTKDPTNTGRAVYRVYFDRDATSAVGANGSSTSCDLNTGAGGKLVYMHVFDSSSGREGVSYINRSWNSSAATVDWETKTCTDYSWLDGNASGINTKLGDGWYVVDRNVSYNKNIQVVGNANIILVDGYKLTAEGGVSIQTDKTLTIYGQRNDTGTLYTHASSGPGIGGTGDILAGHLVVHGGKVDAASGSHNNAGIGGGNGEGSGIQSVTIYGGDVKAIGESSGAGIGKGQHNNHWEDITIYGGHVTAVGGNQSAGIGGGEDRGNGVISIYGGIVDATGGGGGAGIGGGKGGDNDNGIRIHGGEITATGGEGGAGIGGGASGKGGAITITGGTIEAQGGEEAAGIGTGKESDSNDTVIVIDGGTITATGGKNDGAGIGGGTLSGVKSITINNGEITAVGKDLAAAIGSSCHKGIESIEINGGKITAWIDDKDGGPGTGACIGGGFGSKATFDLIRITGGSISVRNPGSGAGIGGGYASDGGLIEILGGEISSGSYKGAGIGSGADAEFPTTIKISNACVYASSGSRGAGIGGGERSDGGYITISSGYVTATGGYMEYDFWVEQMNFLTNTNYDYPEASWGALVGWLITGLLADDEFSGAGIGGGAGGDGGDVVISGGVVIVKGGKSSTAIGHGDEAEDEGSLSLYPEAQVWVGTDEEHIQPFPVAAENRVTALQTNVFGEIRYCDHPDCDYIDNEDGLTHTVICKYCGFVKRDERHFFHADDKCVCGFKFQELVLHDDADNTEALAAFNMHSATVRLSGRTLYKDGSWNTICLPFDVSDFDETPLEGATVRALSTVSLADGVLTLTFSEDLKSIKAGKPYIVRWNGGADIKNPVFYGVSVENTLNADTISGITFKGSFSPVSLTADDKTRFFVGSDNQLYYPTSALNINSCRGYFQLNGVNLNSVRSFVMDAREKPVPEAFGTEE